METFTILPAGTGRRRLYRNSDPIMAFPTGSPIDQALTMLVAAHTTDAMRQSIVQATEIVARRAAEQIMEAMLTVSYDGEDDEAYMQSMRDLVASIIWNEMNGRTVSAPPAVSERPKLALVRTTED